MESVTFFCFTISIALFSLFLYITKLALFTASCKCDVCKSYLTRSWSPEFDNLSDWYAHLLRRSPTGTIHIHVLNNIITANPENVEHMLKNNFENYPKGRRFYAILGDLLGKGIFNVDGHSWRFQRKIASLELGSVSIRTHAFEIVSSEIQNRLLPLLTSVQNGAFDLQDVFRRFAFDTTCRFSFGYDPECLRSSVSDTGSDDDSSLPVSDFAVAFDVASALSAKRAMIVTPLVWKMQRLLNLGDERKLKEAIRKIDLLAGDLINHRREVGFSTKKDLLSRFMGTITDDRYLRDIVVSFLLAGRDTVAAALTSFFWLVAQHPEVEQAIRAESDRVKTSEGNPSFGEMREMHYLQAALYESMRLFPPVQFDSKFCQADDTLPDETRVGKGTRVTYHPYAMGRMERVWGSDCLEFKPERWLEKGVFRPVSAFKYPVFQAGVRVCLGKEMAMMEMKSVALALLRQFDIRVAPKVNQKTPQFVPGLTATMKGGLPVVIHERR